MAPGGGGGGSFGSTKDGGAATPPADEGRPTAKYRIAPMKPANTMTITQVSLFPALNIGSSGTSIASTSAQITRTSF